MTAMQRRTMAVILYQGKFCSEQINLPKEPKSNLRKWNSATDKLTCQMAKEFGYQGLRSYMMALSK